MKDLRVHTRGSYSIGTALDLTDAQLESIVRLLYKPTRTESAPLAGRYGMNRAHIEGLGNLVVKHYVRGGCLRWLVERHYFRWGKTRAEREFTFLRRVRSLGVNAPEPVAFAHEGGILYKAWLVMQEIEDSRSLAELSPLDENASVNLLPEFARQLGILIRNRIFHVDLHPGNVVADYKGTVYILDFDKAVFWRYRKNTLRDHYLHRWRRAVIKYGLPDILSERVSLALRERFD